jgi:hypothetical protein
MRGIKKVLAKIGLVGSFAIGMFATASTAHADSSAPDSFWSNVIASQNSASHHIVVPKPVRAVRTPSKPVKPVPPISISATTGTLVYLRSHHRDPAMVFEIKLSKAPGKNEVTVNYQTSGSNLTADSLFDNVNGSAIFHGTSVKYKVYVPVIGPLGKDPSNYIALQLSDPNDGVITNGTGFAELVAKGHVR